MGLIPKNIDSFYKSNLDFGGLYQGDILQADKIGLKEEGVEGSPDYWMVITKTCDLSFKNDEMTLRGENISLTPISKLKLILKKFNHVESEILSKIKPPIVLFAIKNLLSTFLLSNFNNKKIKSLLEDKISRFMFLPPDGKIFNEPMILDFNIIVGLDGGDAEEVDAALKSKVLELVSPFREKVAQNFATHYSNIGFDDSCIRDDAYLTELQAKYNETRGLT